MNGLLLINRESATDTLTVRILLTVGLSVAFILLVLTHVKHVFRKLDCNLFQFCARPTLKHADFVISTIFRGAFTLSYLHSIYFTVRLLIEDSFDIHVPSFY